MIVEIVNAMIALSLLFLPGMNVSNRLKIPTLIEWIGLSILFSMAITGSIYYFFSIWHVITPLYSYALFFLSILFLRGSRPSYSKSLPGDFFNSKLDFLTHLILIGGVMVLGGLFLFVPTQIDDNSYDSLSYHIPFIQSFAEKGRVESTVTVENTYGRLLNYFPKLYEALLGGIKQISGLYEMIPFAVFLSIILLLWGITQYYGNSNPWAPALFLGGFEIIAQFLSFYLDAFLALLVVGVIWLVARYEKEKEQKYLALIFFLLGTMVATKFGSIGFGIVVAAILLPILKRKILLAGSFIVGGGYFLVHYFFTSKTALNAVAGNNGILISGNLINEVLMNITTLLEGFFIESVVFGFFPFIIFGIAYGVYCAFKVNDFKNKIYGISMLFFIIFILVTESNSRLDSFPRYFIPLYAISCIYAAALIEKVVDLFRKNRLRDFFKLLILIICLVPLLLNATITYGFLEGRMHGITVNDRMQQVLSIIPNNPDTSVFFANTPNGITVNLEKVRQLDYTSFKQFSIPICDFLRSERINFLVVFYPENPRDDLGAITPALMNEISAGRCGRLVDDTSAFMHLYRIS